MKREDIKHWIPIVIIALLIFVSYLIIKDYIVALVASAILAFLVMPVYKWLNKKMPSWLAASICIAVVILIIVIPVIMTVLLVMLELSTYLSSDLILQIIRKISSIDLINWAGFNLTTIRNEVATIIVNYLGDLTARIPHLIISLLILIIAMFYLLRDWDSIIKRMKKYILSENKEKVSKDIAQITRSVVYGSLLIALIQFVISLVGFWLLGFQYSLIFATLIAIFAFLPALGPIIIWVPAAIISFIQGEYFVAIGVVILGLILTLYTDTILRAKLSVKGTQVHPVTMIVGIVGGIILFGILGFVIGPLILSYTLTLLEDLIDN